MANKGLNEARFWIHNIPNLGNMTSCCCNKSSIRGGTTAVGVDIIYTEFSHNCLIAQNKLSAITGESSIGTIILLCFKYDVQFKFKHQHMLCPFSHVCHTLFCTDLTPAQ